MTSEVVVAIAQLSPVFLDRAATVARACDAIAEAAREGARLIVFPEAFVPGYPVWVWSTTPGDTATLRSLYSVLLDQAVTIPDASTELLAAAAAQHGIAVAIGVNERNADASNTSLYNTLIFIDEKGQLLGRHRKLVPTAGERLVHASGDGSSLVTYPSPAGQLGGLICWENYMPLARYALYAAGMQMHVAPTWDRGEPWLSTLRHIAKEGRVYVAGCCSAMRLDDIPDRYPFKANVAHRDGWVNPGDSMLVDPDGKIVAGPLHAATGILYGRIDPAKVTGSRFQLDVAGHYARPDIFNLSVDRTPRRAGPS